MGLLDDLDARRERVAQTKENSARLAQAYGVFQSTGTGTFHFEDRIDFGLTFTEKPMVSYGCSIDVDDLEGLIDAANIDEVAVDSDDTPLPLCTGYVVDWDQDDRDFYTGCWVSVRVVLPIEMAAAATPQLTTLGALAVDVKVEHHFTFGAIGMKDIPPDTTDAVN